jgi:hypothetical protein
MAEPKAFIDLCFFRTGEILDWGTRNCHIGLGLVKKRDEEDSALFRLKSSVINRCLWASALLCQRYLGRRRL